MPTFTMTYTRPSTEIDWFYYPSEIVAHRKSLKMVSHTVIESADNLTMTRVSTFETQEDLDTFINDPVLASIVSTREAYGKLFNITTTTAIT
jgi:hypothetical protein